MVSFIQLLPIISTILGATSVFGLTVNTPATLIVCQPVALSWTGTTTSPYYVAIKNGGDASGAALEQLGPFTELTTTWTVNQPAGTSITIAVTDGTGAINYSSQVTVQAGTTTSCLTSSGSSSSTSSAAAAASGSSGSSGSSASAASGSAKASASASGSASRSAAAASASATSSALPTINNKSLVSFGAFLLVAAVFAL